MRTQAYSSNYVRREDGTLIDLTQSILTGAPVVVDEREVYLVNKYPYAPRGDLIALADGTTVSYVDLLLSTGGTGGGITLQGVELLIERHNADKESHAVKTYVKDFTTPVSTWSIQHNLDADYSMLTIICNDTEGNFLIGDINTDLSTNNMLVIEFKESIAGKVIIKK